jgi:hypothetical protein
VYFNLGYYNHVFIKCSAVRRPQSTPRLKIVYQIKIGCSCFSYSIYALQFINTLKQHLTSSKTLHPLLIHITWKNNPQIVVYIDSLCQGSRTSAHANTKRALGTRLYCYQDHLLHFLLPKIRNGKIHIYYLIYLIVYKLLHIRYCMHFVLLL